MTFALGTDTAGSGRVPAAFNDIVGLKPSRRPDQRRRRRARLPVARLRLDLRHQRRRRCGGARGRRRVSTRADPYSRAPLTPLDGRCRRAPPASASACRAQQDLVFFGDGEVEALFDQAVERLAAIGGQAVEVDLAPFFEVARLLYEGPWVAERTAVVGDFLAAHPTRPTRPSPGIIKKGATLAAPAVFDALHRLEALRRERRAAWSAIDVLLAPTAPTAYTVEAVRGRSDQAQFQPRRLHQFRQSARPRGGGGAGRLRRQRPAGGRDADRPDPFRSCAAVARRRAASRRATTAGALGLPLPSQGRRDGEWSDGGGFDLVAVGAHMSRPAAQPPTRRHRRPLIATVRTAPIYRLVALADLIRRSPAWCASKRAARRLNARSGACPPPLSAPSSPASSRRTRSARWRLKTAAGCRASSATRSRRWAARHRRLWRLARLARRPGRRRRAGARRAVRFAQPVAGLSGGSPTKSRRISSAIASAAISTVVNDAPTM